MGIETTRWDTDDYLDGAEAIVACLETVFEEGDAELIALALNNVGRANNLEKGTLAAHSAIASVIRTSKAPGLERTARAA